MTDEIAGDHQTEGEMTEVEGQWTEREGVESRTGTERRWTEISISKFTVHVIPCCLVNHYVCVCICD